jgi:GNAT superfamily N-acetyltransferase
MYRATLVSSKCWPPPSHPGQSSRPVPCWHWWAGWRCSWITRRPGSAHGGIRRPRRAGASGVRGARSTGWPASGRRSPDGPWRRGGPRARGWPTPPSGRCAPSRRRGRRGDTTVMLIGDPAGGHGIVRFRLQTTANELEAHLAQLSVQPQPRGQGLGTRLLRAIIDDAKARARRTWTSARARTTTPPARRTRGPSSTATRPGLGATGALLREGPLI